MGRKDQNRLISTDRGLASWSFFAAIKKHPRQLAISFLTADATAGTKSPCTAESFAAEERPPADATKERQMTLPQTLPESTGAACVRIKSTATGRVVNTKMNLLGVSKMKWRQRKNDRRIIHGSRSCGDYFRSVR